MEDYTSTSTPRALLVRSRISGHLEAVFPDAEVREDEGSDYRFRATIAREVVGEALFNRVMKLHATNFKDSVTSKPLRAAYGEFWEVMRRLQERYRHHTSR